MSKALYLGIKAVPLANFKSQNCEYCGKVVSTKCFRDFGEGLCVLGRNRFENSEKHIQVLLHAKCKLKYIKEILEKEGYKIKLEKESDKIGWMTK